MKTNIFLTLMLGAGALFCSCIDGDWDTPDMNMPLYGNNSLMEGTVVEIKQLKEKYKTAIENNDTAHITDDIQIKGVVIGNDAGGNIYNAIFVQDKNAAIQINVTATGLSKFIPVGREVLINLKGLHIGGYGQLPQIGKAYVNPTSGSLSVGRIDNKEWQKRVRLLGNGNQLSEELIDTLEFFDKNGDIARNIATETGCLVKLSGVSFADADGKIQYAPETAPDIKGNAVNRGFVGFSMNKLVLRTSIYSQFANNVMPQGKVDVYGIATRFRDTWQILVRTEEDIKVASK